MSNNFLNFNLFLSLFGSRVAASLPQCVGMCMWMRQCGMWEEALWGVNLTVGGGAMTNLNFVMLVTLARLGFWPASRRVGGRSRSSTSLFSSFSSSATLSVMQPFETIAVSTMMNLLALHVWLRRNLDGLTFDDRFQVFV